MPEFELNRTRSPCYKEGGFTIKNGIIRGENRLYFDSTVFNFGEYLLDTIKDNSNLVCQVNGANGTEDTFLDLADRSVRCALWLNDQKLQPGDVIGIVSKNHFDSVTPCLASLYTGLIFNPWRTLEISKDDVKNYLNLTKPKVLFVDDEFSNMVGEVVKKEKTNLKIVTFESVPGFYSFAEIITRQESKKVQNFRCKKLTEAEYPAMIIYTSGTSGFLKGALLSHKSLFGNVGFASELLGNCKIALWYSRPAWISGIIFELACLAKLTKRVIANDFSVDSLGKLVQTFQVDWIKLAPTVYLTYEALTKHDMSSVKNIGIGGSVFKEKSRVALERALPNAKILQTYGSTELGGIVIHQTQSGNFKSLGTIVCNVEMKIIDPINGRILGKNEQGEACFKSPFMMIAYYNDEVNTKKTIDAEGWLHSGDLCSYDENGYIYFHDRICFLIKWRNHKVSPEKIEKLIRTYPGVVEVVVVGVPNSKDFEWPLAFVIKSPDSDITKEDISQLVEKNLPEQMWLRAGVMFLDKFPQSKTAKVPRQELRKMAIPYRWKFEGELKVGSDFFPPKGKGSLQLWQITIIDEFLNFHVQQNRSTAHILFGAVSI